MVFLRLLQPLGIDFPQFYEASLMVHQNLNPYLTLLTSPGPFNYPPPFFLAFWWLGFLPFEVAAVIWNLFSLFAFVVTIYLLTRGKHFWLWLLVLTLPFFPLKHNLASGQINTFVLFFSVLGILVNPIFLGFAASIKLTPAAIAIYFLIRRQWRRLAAFIVSFALFFGLSFLIIPWQSQNLYYFSVFDNAFPLAGKELYYNQSLLGFLTRTFSGPLVVLASYYVLSILIISLTWWRGRRIVKERLVAAVFCLPLLLSPLVWQHHLVFAVVPLILLASRRDWKALLVIYFLLAFDIKNFAAVPREFIFVLSHQFYSILALWILALWRERFWQILSFLWVGSILVAHVFSLSCRGGFC